MNHSLNPFATRMIFFRIGWMDHYAGLQDDHIEGGGANVERFGFGHEIMNFKPFEGAFFGYVKPPGSRNRDGKLPSIKLERLGALRTADRIENVLIVWVAKKPHEGTVVVGWYQNAVVFRDCRVSPKGSERQYMGEDLGYYAKSAGSDVCLLSPNERFKICDGIAGKAKGSFGRSNIWYADDPDSALHRETRETVLIRCSNRISSDQTAFERSQFPRQHNLRRRQQVEAAAVKEVSSYFERLNYLVKFVEMDNVGWDLEATRSDGDLKLEVKGLSGPNVVVEVTPNEYARMLEHRHNYRLCVVTCALETPALHIFSFSPQSGRWESSDFPQSELEIEEVVAARCRASRG